MTQQQQQQQDEKVTIGPFRRKKIIARQTTETMGNMPRFAKALIKTFMDITLDRDNCFKIPSLMPCCTIITAILIIIIILPEIIIITIITTIIIDPGDGLGLSLPPGQWVRENHTPFAYCTLGAAFPSIPL